MEQETKYAGFWLRLVASIIDGFVLQIAGGIVGFILPFSKVDTQLLEKASDPEALNALISQMSGPISASIAISGAIAWLYFAFMESSEYQATLGKMALGIKVTDMKGAKLTFARATGRYFAKYISSFTLLIGYIMAAFTEKKQALHDIIAGALVVRK